MSSLATIPPGAYAPSEVWHEPPPAYDPDVADRAELEVIDGYLVDADGEIHGMASVQADFHVTNEQTAHWVMQKMLLTEADIMAVDAMEKTILENLPRRLRAPQKQSRRNYLAFRFNSELEAFARANLRGKLKQWRCAYGCVAFRNAPVGVAVTDEAKAIEWARANGHPEAIKVTEKFLVSQVKETLLKGLPRRRKTRLRAQAGEGNVFDLLHTRKLLGVRGEGRGAR